MILDASSVINIRDQDELDIAQFDSFDIDETKCLFPSGHQFVYEWTDWTVGGYVYYSCGLYYTCVNTEGEEKDIDHNTLVDILNGESDD